MLQLSLEMVIILALVFFVIGLLVGVSISRPRGPYV